MHSGNQHFSFINRLKVISSEVGREVEGAGGVGVGAGECNRITEVETETVTGWKITCSDTLKPVYPCSHVSPVVVTSCF